MTNIMVCKTIERPYRITYKLCHDETLVEYSINKIGEYFASE